MSNANSVDSLARSLLEVIGLNQSSAVSGGNGGVTVYAKNNGPTVTTSPAPPQELDAKVDLYE